MTPGSLGSLFSRLCLSQYPAQPGPGQQPPLAPPGPGSEVPFSNWHCANVSQYTTGQHWEQFLGGSTGLGLVLTPVIFLTFKWRWQNSRLTKDAGRALRNPTGCTYQCQPVLGVKLTGAILTTRTWCQQYLTLIRICSCYIFLVSVLYCCAMISC